MRGYGIGEAAKRAGCSVQTVRHYEAIGLLAAPSRSGGRRRYDEADLRRLGFIRHARALGFAMPAIRELLGLSAEPENSCDGADAIARRHLETVEARIAALSELRDALRAMLVGELHGRIGDCRVIETLADHGRCSGPHPRTDHAGGEPPA